MPEITKEQLIIIIGVIIMLLIGCVYGVWENKRIITQSSPQTSISIKCPKIRQNDVKIWVHVSGAVINEGVYRLYAGDRVFDVLKMSKVSDQADLNGINLAESLSDGQKVFIPYKGVQGSNTGDTQIKGSSNTIKVNINSADLQKFDSLPGVGAVMAGRIIEYRSEKGRFSNIEQLKEVPGISEKKFEKLRKYVTVN
jgi:competence protein ComEA